MEHKISATFYGMTKEDFDSIKDKYDGTAHISPDGRYDVTIDILTTNDEEFVNHTLKSAHIGVS